MENIILRGSSIFYTLDKQTQVTCLVLNVGDQCIQRPCERKEDETLNYFRFKLSPRNKISNQLNLLSILDLLATVFIALAIILTESFALQNSGTV